MRAYKRDRAYYSGLIPFNEHKHYCQNIECKRLEKHKPLKEKNMIYYEKIWLCKSCYNEKSNRRI